MHKLKDFSYLFAGAGALAAAFTLFLTVGTHAAADGSKIYAENCNSCHAKGGNIMDPKKPVTGSKILASKKKFKEYMLKQQGLMPPYIKIANNDEELTALYDYCKSLK